MNFDISEEQQMLQETVSQLIENECPLSRIREIFEGTDGYDPALWKGMVEMGVAGLQIPEEYGGAGLEMLDQALAAETLAYAGAPGPFLGHALAGLALVLGGSEEQKQRWLPRLAQGEALGTVALAEGDNVWQPEQWKLAGGSTLLGQKAYVPYADMAGVIIVGVAGPGLVLVEKGASGITTENYDLVDRARQLCTVSFDSTPCEVLPEGAAASERVRDAALVLLAADAFGSGQRLLDMCVQYAKEREQFGVTIGHFQALKHQLANMALEIEPTRGLYWYAAHVFDHVQDESARMAALAKAHITDRTMQIARDAVEAHGGIGFTWECDVQIWFKRAMFDRAWMGTPSVHRERAAQMAGW
ncbi:MAG: acyl-CoA dehydrogenase [Deltaproteobacteria bacterium]|nr:MAG: acyl-CoA dehydrogenase [Deltaproteobacteria bacterium]